MLVMVKKGMQHSQVEFRVTLIEMASLSERAQIVWHIGEEEEISEACLRLQGLMESAALSGRNALGVMAGVGHVKRHVLEHTSTSLPDDRTEEACAGCL